MLICKNDNAVNLKMLKKTSAGFWAVRGQQIEQLYGVIKAQV